jgi:hypothetical protein
MREETELLSNTLKEVAKAILKDTEDTGKFVEGRSKGLSTQVLRLRRVLVQGLHAGYTSNWLWPSII